MTQSQLVVHSPARCVIIATDMIRGTSAGLIVYMAQIGSFVPADAAVLGPVDRLFSRIQSIDRCCAVL
jgi:DNA mismatch repair protein MutS